MNIATFDFNESPLRAALDEKGEPWFVAADVCRVLDVANARDAVAGLDADDVGNTDIIDSLGRKQTANTVNEAGLYQLVFGSRKPEAKEFKRWVTKEVLPSIRKTGRYAAPGSLTGAEESQVQRIIDHLDAAIEDKRAGRMSNADASVLANLTCQFLKAFDVKLRLRAGVALEGPKS